MARLQATEHLTSAPTSFWNFLFDFEWKIGATLTHSLSSWSLILEILCWQDRLLDLLSIIDPEISESDLDQALAFFLSALRSMVSG